MPPKGSRKRQKVKKDEASVENPTAEVTKKAKKTKGNVFKRKALALVEDLRSEFGDIEVDLNPSVPRRGSFEFVLVRDGQDDETVWTGLKKGPPRKLKFPEAEEVITAIKKIL